jgi:N utilization substance protein B
MTERSASLPPGPRRGVARLAAVQALYQAELTGATGAEVVDEFIAHRLGRDIDGVTCAEADADFFAELVRGTLERQGEIDDLLGDALVEGWPLARLDRTLRAALRAGAFELLARPDVPARVVIDEYVDVAHAFFDGAEPGLVNGVLDGLGRRLRPGELKGDGDQRPARAR